MKLFNLLYTQYKRILECLPQVLGSQYEIIREEEYSVENIHKTVHWIDSSKSPFYGEYTLFGKILLNENRLSQVSKNGINCVFLHEVGHSRPHHLVSLCLVSLRIILVPIIIIGLLPIPAVILIIAFMLIWWIDEGFAELFAIKTLGEEKYLAARDELDDQRNLGKISRLIIRIVYPTNKWVFKYAKWRGHV